MLKALQIKTFGEVVIWAEIRKRSKSENEKILDCGILNTENEKPLISHIILQNVAKKVSDTALSRGRPAAEKDCCTLF